MKRCPHCRRDYFDDSLRFCLDDGTSLLEGPGSDPHGTEILPSEQPTRALPSENDLAKTTRSKKFRLWYLVVPLLLTAIAVAGFSAYRSLVDKNADSIRSLAVLPLENLSGDAGQEFISDGITESIIGNLSKINTLRVTSRTSAMKFKRSGKTIPEIAKELGVDATIEGSVQRSEDNLRVNLQLVHGATDTPVWSQRYERKMSDILRLESEIANAVASEIKIKLTPEEEKRIGDQGSIDPRAAEAALLGKHYFRQFTAEGTRKAVEEFQNAVNFQPDYADAWGGLADAWTASAMNGNMRMSAAKEPTRKAAERALEIDPDNAAGHIAMCFYENNYTFDWAAGEKHCKRGIELSPGNGKAHFAYAFLLARQERWEDMSAQMEEAMRVDPDEAWWPFVHGSFLITAGRPDQALGMFDRANALAERWGARSQRWAARSERYMVEGKYEDALSAAEKEGDVIAAARAFARMGDRPRALEKLKDANPNDVFGPILVYAALGDRDTAFEMLNRNLDTNEGFMGRYGELVELNNLKSDPRWQALLKRMNRG